MTRAPINPYQQAGAAIRFDWGSEGAAAIAKSAAAAVVIDVLSFTTTLTVALDAGVGVYPYRFRDATAAAFAASRSAVLAVGRREGGPDGISLSPRSLRRAVADGRLNDGRGLVLPSPNGSAICRDLMDSGVTVLGASFRNIRAVARHLSTRFRGGPVAVVAAGERWPGDRLRPAAEDLWGAGALIGTLIELGFGKASPEALTAVGAYRAVAGSLKSAVRDCASGLELIEDGYGDELDVALEIDATSVVPVLIGDCFRAG